MEIDRLEVVVESKASKACAELDKMIAKLKQVNTAMRSISSTNPINESKASNAIKSTTRGMKGYYTAATKARKSTLSLAVAFGKFYANCFLVIRGIKALGKSIESSMDYIETYNYFNVITDKIGAEFGNAWKENGYSSAEEYSKSFRKRLNNLTTQMTGFNIGDEGGLYMSGNVGLGLDPEKIMAYQANISSITNAVGLMGETSVNTSKALTMLVADLSSLKNQDLESVMKNLQSGLIGQSRALYKYGIDITNNTLQTYAYANGIDKAVQAMTQAEKMQLRLLAILDQSKVAYGDMANTISGVANQFRIFKQQVSNLARIIGNLFIPVLQTVLPYINGFIIALQRLFTWIGNLLGVKRESLMDGISSGYTDTGLEELYDNAEDVTGALEDANKAANKLKKTIHSYDELHVASDPNSGNENTSIGGSGGIDLSSAIADALADYEKVWNEAMKKEENLSEFENLLNNFEAAIEGADLLDKEKRHILYGIENEIPPIIKKYGYDRFQYELGFRIVGLGELSFPKYTFQYISPGGNASTKCDIIMDIENLNRFIHYLSENIKFRQSVAGQRALLTSSLRKKILLRDNYTCKKCGNSASKEPNLLLEIDHIIPLAKGGMTSEDNLQVLCWRCNRSKGAKME